MRNSSPTGSFVRQAAILASASIIVRLLGFMYRIPLTHLIGDVGNAYYIAAYRVYTIAIVATSGALIATISRLTSERIANGEYRNAHELFKTAMGFAFVFGLVTAVLMFMFSCTLANALNLPGSGLSIKALAPAVMFVSVLAVIRGYFQGMKTAKPTAISQVLEQIAKIIISVFLAFLFFNPVQIEYSAAGAAMGTSFSVMIAVIVMLVIYLKRRDKLLSRVASDNTSYKENKSDQIVRLVYTSSPIVLSSFVLIIGGFIDLVMAGNLIPMSGVFSQSDVRILIGQFEGKFILLTTLPISLSMVLSAAVLPEITSSKAIDDNVSVKQKANMALRFSLILAFPSTVGISVLAYPILALLFPAHPDGGTLLTIGGVSIVFMSIVHVTTGVLQGIGRVTVPLIGAIIALVVKIAINFLLMPIPWLNINGAVISTIVYAIVAAFINIFFIRRYAGFSFDIRHSVVKPLLASTSMGLLCFILYNAFTVFIPSAISTVLTIAIGTIAYLAMLILLKGFNTIDLDVLPIPRQLKKIINSRL